MFSKLLAWFKRHKILTVFLILVVLVLGIQAKYWYEDYRIEQVHKSIIEGHNWQLVEVVEYGNSWCLNACTGVINKYINEDDTELDPDFFVDIIRKTGFSITHASDTCDGSDSTLLAENTRCTFMGERGGLELSMSLLDRESTESDTGTISVSVSYKE